MHVLRNGVPDSFMNSPTRRRWARVENQWISQPITTPISRKAIMTSESGTCEVRKTQSICTFSKLLMMNTVATTTSTIRTIQRITR